MYFESGCEINKELVVELSFDHIKQIKNIETFAHIPQCLNLVSNIFKIWARA